MPTKPMQWSLAKLRSEGWTCHIVEKFNRFSMRRIDVFGFGDVLAMRPGEIALVQTTSASNMAAHEKKIKALPEYRQWYEAGGIVILHGWRNKNSVREKRTHFKKADDVAVDVMLELRYRLNLKLSPEQALTLRKSVAEIISKGFYRTITFPKKNKPCIAK